MDINTCLTTTAHLMTPQACLQCQSLLQATWHSSSTVTIEVRILDCCGLMVIKAGQNYLLFKPSDAKRKRMSKLLQTLKRLIKRILKRTNSLDEVEEKLLTTKESLFCQQEANNSSMDEHLSQRGTSDFLCSVKKPQKGPSAKSELRGRSRSRSRSRNRMEEAAFNVAKKAT